jgi:hypothetical protein
MTDLVGAPVVSGRGPLWARVVFVVAAIVCMAYVRLVVFPNDIVPLAYALPLLVCLWTRDRVMLWVMTAAFLTMVVTKAAMLFGADADVGQKWIFLIMQVANTIVPAAVIHAVILLTARLEANVAVLEQTNGELEASNEELAAREEEITRQNEELQSQAEELEQHTEELNSQAEELQVLNEQLAARERTLNDLL